MKNDEKLLIFNIQKYSLHDGSGIRTVVFLKGCPLRCRWCCNPESQNAYREIIYRRSHCIGKEKCGMCMDAGPVNAVSFDEDGRAVLDFSKCMRDVEWTKICPTQALKVEGREISIDEILQIVEQDAVFYRRGNGGLTVSGGEPFLQSAVVALLKKAKEHRINTAVETCGYADRERLLAAANYLDAIYFDIKSVDDGKHEEYTGVSGVKIRQNLTDLYQAFPGKKIIVRTPVIPGFNDSEEELNQIRRFLDGFPGIEWERLPYHRYGVGKYEMLGRAYLMDDGC